MEKFDTSVAFKINWHNAMEKIDTSDWEDMESCFQDRMVITDYCVKTWPVMLLRVDLTRCNDLLNISTAAYIEIPGFHPLLVEYTTTEDMLSAS